MRIEIFVVRSEKENKDRLGIAKGALIRLFGGLTVIPKCQGYWLNENKEIEADSVEIWLIYADFPEADTKANAIFKQTKMNAFLSILELIKDATRQKSQAYALNDKIYFL